MLFMREEEETRRANAEDEEDDDSSDIGYNIVMGSKYQKAYKNRTRGLASSQSKFISADYDDEEEDPDAYSYPKIYKDDRISSLQDDE